MPGSLYMHGIKCNAPGKSLLFGVMLASQKTVRAFIITNRNAKTELPTDLQENSPVCVLEYGLNMPTPIPDLEVTDDGIKATLSFNQTPTPTFVPWSEVVGIGIQGETMIAVDVIPESAAPEAKPERGGLKLV